MQFKRRAYLETKTTVPAAEAFITMNIVKTGSTATKLEASQFYNGGIAQFWNESAARATTMKMYYSMKETPGAITTGDWNEYDSVEVVADDGTAAGTSEILWSRPYKWIAFTSVAAASTASSLLMEVYGY